MFHKLLRPLNTCNYRNLHFLFSNGHSGLLHNTIQNSIILKCHQTTAPKSFDEIPGPYVFPIIKNFYLIPFFLWNADKIIQTESAHFQKYGPIFKQVFLENLVRVYKAEDVENIMRKEGKYPQRINLDLWVNWKKQNNVSLGVLLEEGEQWKIYRSQLDKRMLKRNFVAAYFNHFKNISLDLIEKIEASNQENQPYFPQLEEHLFRWALESAGFVVYEIPLGGKQVSEQSMNLVQAISNIFKCTNKLIFMPEWARKLFMKKYNELFTNSWAVVNETTRDIVGKKLKKLASGDTENDYGFLRHMLTSEMTEEEIFGNITELVLGATETSSGTLLWLLHELGKQPELQEEIYEQICQLPQQQPHSIDDLDKLPLVKAVVKETLRLYPVIHAIPRILKEDVVLSNYLVPSGTTILFNLYHMGRSEEYFKNASKFKPQRWLRENNSGDGPTHKFAWIPFGFGPRSCIGRRIAEFELHLVVCMLVSRYKMITADTSPVGLVYKSFPAPSRPIRIKFTPRDQKQ